MTSTAMANRNLAVTNSTSGTVSILENTGDGPIRARRRDHRTDESPPDRVRVTGTATETVISPWASRWEAILVS